jgi:hypothetical protein
MVHDGDLVHTARRSAAREDEASIEALGNSERGGKGCVASMTEFRDATGPGVADATETRFGSLVL